MFYLYFLEIYFFIRLNACRWNRSSALMTLNTLLGGKMVINLE